MYGETKEPVVEDVGLDNFLSTTRSKKQATGTGTRSPRAQGGFKVYPGVRLGLSYTSDTTGSKHSSNVSCIMIDTLYHDSRWWAPLVPYLWGLLNMQYY